MVDKKESNAFESLDDRFRIKWSEQSSTELEKIRVILDHERRALDNERVKLAEDFGAREKSLIAQLEATRKKLSLRESEIESRLRDSEKRSKAMASELQAERDAATRVNEKILTRARQQSNELLSLRADLDANRAELEAQKSDFEQEKLRYQTESKTKLKENSSKFVDVTVNELKKTESNFTTTSRNWSVLGGVSLIFGLGIMTYFSYLSAGIVGPQMSWSVLTFYGIKGAVIAAIVTALARYSFLLASKYLQESLRTADRMHAIKFGQLYIETYGVSAEWDQVREAFSDWNSNSAVKVVEAFDDAKAAEGISAKDDLSKFPVEKLTELVKAIRSSTS